MFGEVAKIGVVGDQRLIMVDAELGDQRISNERAQFEREQFAARFRCAVPKPRQNFEQRKSIHHIDMMAGQIGMAEYLDEHRGWNSDISRCQRGVELLDAGPCLAQQVGDQR